MHSSDNEMKIQDLDKDNMDDHQSYGMSPRSTDSDDIKMRFCFICRETGKQNWPVFSCILVYTAILV